MAVAVAAIKVGCLYSSCFHGMRSEQRRACDWRHTHPCQVAVIKVGRVLRAPCCLDADQRWLQGRAAGTGSLEWCCGRGSHLVGLILTHCQLQCWQSSAICPQLISCHGCLTEVALLWPPSRWATAYGYQPASMHGSNKFRHIQQAHPDLDSA